MQKRTREILALVLLGVFAIVGVGAMAWYILVGHNWNVAASNIDDSIGQMEGYSVVLYEGTRLPGAGGDAVDVGAAAASYREKGAAVFTVDTGNLARYSEPFVVAKGGVRMGFLAAGRAELRSSIRSDARSLAEQGAEYIVAVTDDPRLAAEAADRLVGGISIIVCGAPKGPSPDGEYRGSTFCVSAPTIGEVGAVIISPSGVLSSKTVDPGEPDGGSSAERAEEGDAPGSREN